MSFVLLKLGAVPFGAITFSAVILEACGAHIPVSFALLPVILASIEVALGLIAVILPPAGACEKALPKGVATIVPESNLTLRH